ncbi:Hsp20/alpha crystallin family protein [Herbaspirillum seropedicae]|uniref:Molecular chaperone, small heat shock protein n=1 Tax=Herbaspirillum seropedicae (strain SmR1) TaxID=757424 RepID=D8IVF2_HERSS|nr:Hsp20/alpha crystallin family protein [Herbaspirillum seropedicae]ADJ63891.1 molecular chaperone, small heat shock protein [Herbaspirillum seropedicae SmR1]AKN65880.1 stress protein [Herbaspirillum seropedicae]AON54703.1 molecular chaperone, small heat shock protein [Herbaspirillum seropedicae]MDR6394247.1 HSP20 family protein [Herbaspirillum seropedicae]NQE29030.1 stress protein [Herbaspirillum seropedicae]
MNRDLPSLAPLSDVARFDPIGSFEDLLREIRQAPLGRWMEARQTMKMDVSENESSYTVKAELPGMKKENIKVDVDGNKVSIAAEASENQEEKNGDTWIRCERSSERLHRVFSLAHEVDGEKSVARYEDGVLTLVLPKKNGKQSRQINVQ